MDEVLPKAFLFAIQLVLAMLSSILVPTVANPWLLFVAVPMAVAVVYISQYYLKTSRQLKRLESINRSPVFSHISDTIDGLETIRTRARQKDFEEQFYRYVVQYQPVVLYNIKVQERCYLSCHGRGTEKRFEYLAL